MHGQQAGSSQFQGLAVSDHAHAGAPVSGPQSLDLEAGPAVFWVLGHQRDPRILEESEVVVHPVRVGVAELFGTLLPDDLWDCMATFSYAGRTVRAHLKQRQQFLIDTGT